MAQILFLEPFFYFGGHFSAISGRGPFSIFFPIFPGFLRRTGFPFCRWPPHTQELPSAGPAGEGEERLPWQPSCQECAVELEGEQELDIQHAAALSMPLCSALSIFRDGETTIKINFAVLGGGGKLGAEREIVQNAFFFSVGSATTIEF